MPLDPLQEEVARVALHLAEAGQVALAGGGAMLAHEFVDRSTTDVDLFTPEAGEVGPFTDALSTALRERGYAVDVTRREEAFTHLQVAAPDGRQVAVEVAQDARMLPPAQLAVGAVLHPDELAADKTLALFGRGSARDLVDVDALAGTGGSGCSSSPPRKTRVRPRGVRRRAQRCRGPVEPGVHRPGNHRGGDGAAAPDRRRLALLAGRSSQQPRPP